MTLDGNSEVMHQF